MPTRPILRAFIIAAGVAVCITAFLWGNYLLGPECGAMYAAIVLGLLWLLARSRTAVRAVALAILSITVGLVMASPASINPDVQHFIDNQAVDRAVRAELTAVFRSDSAYRDLSASSRHLKVVNVTVQGSLGTRSDFDGLRSRITGECPTLGKCFLHWDVIIEDSGQQVSGLDRDLFPDKQESATGAAAYCCIKRQPSQCGSSATFTRRTTMISAACYKVVRKEKA